MRFYKKNKGPKIGDVNTFNHFAIFPITINGETRWLEKVSYKAEFKRLPAGGLVEDGMKSCWVPLEFLN